MKVYRINQCSQSFKSQEKQMVFGFDDEISKQRRDFIRKNYTNQIMPYYEIIEKEGRMEEYGLNKLIAKLRGIKLSQDSLTNVIKAQNQIVEPVEIKQKPDDTVDYNLMKTLPLYNVSPIWSDITTNSYRGQTPCEDISTLKTLKTAGIKRIVDLCGYHGFDDVVKRSGLEYYKFVVDDYFFENDAFQKSYRDTYSSKERFEINKNDFLDKFVKFIQTMQKDYVYIGCEYGKYKTDNALMVNHFFNPAFEDCRNYITLFNKHFLPELVNLYNNLKPEHKKLMGWTKEFDAKLLPRLYKSMKEHNIWH